MSVIDAIGSSTGMFHGDEGIGHSLDAYGLESGKDLGDAQRDAILKSNSHSHSTGLDRTPSTPLWSSLLDDFEWSVRVSNAFKYAKMRTLADLVQCTRWELLRLPNFGKGCLNEVNGVLTGLGLRLGMTPPAADGLDSFSRMPPEPDCRAILMQLVRGEITILAAEHALARCS